MDVTREPPLETLLRQATEDPAHRPAFFAALLQAEVYVIGYTDQGPGLRTIEQGSQMHIEHWQRPDGVRTIPFFTSLARLQQSIEQESRYLALPARVLFELAQGSPLDLNPGASFGKAFEPDEVRALLASGVAHETEQRVLAADTTVHLGVPAAVPPALLTAMRTLLAKHPHVSRAWLATLYDPQAGEVPHLVVGIEARGAVEPILQQAGNVLADVMPQGEAVDLLQIGVGDQGLGDYFAQEVKPFYRRTWLARIKAWFASDGANLRG